MIACVLVVPLALICGPLRGIPFFAMPALVRRLSGQADEGFGEHLDGALILGNQNVFLRSVIE